MPLITLMNEAIGLLIFVALLAGAIAAYCVAMVLFFGRAVTNAELSATLSPWRAFGVGLVNLLFFGTVALLSAGVADSSGIQILAIPALVAVVLVGIGWSIGLSALARVAGVRLLPAANGFQQLAAGAAVLTLASLLPFVGWFILLPYLLFVSLGATIMSLFSGRSGTTRVTENEQL
jgi:hypothetical protein